MELYRKNRPDTFNDIIGNEEVVKQLQSIVKRKDKPHSYLFVGPSGCGKTTLAHIMAKELGVASIIEWNSADFRGIDSARELGNDVQFMPMEGTRAYILEEFHQQTKDAQEALLKVTENCPSHTYFFFTTTEPSKINAALKTRMVIIQVEPLDQEQLEGLVRSVARKEGLELTAEVVAHIAKSAYGSPRRALVMLEKCIGLSVEDQLKVAGYADEAETVALDLCRAIYNGKATWEDIASILRDIKVESEPIRRAVLGYLRAILLKRDAAKAFLLMKHFEKNYYDTGNVGLVMSCYGAWLENQEL